MKLPGPCSAAFGVALVVMASALSSGCRNMPAMLTQLIEARRLAADLHVEFTKASEAANRAVMAATDDTAKSAADESRRARETVERDGAALLPILKSLGHADDLRQFEGFSARFDEYRRLDDEILSLAVENSNVKAQRLSHGPGREAADAFRSSLEAVVRSSTTRENCAAGALAAQARIGVLEIQALQAPHIAEADDDVMTRLEEEMRRSEASARKALDTLVGAPVSAGHAQVAAARAALDRFVAINRELVTLSRRNSNVRSLALTLGRKRTLAALCEDHLRALEQALAAHAFTATR